MDKFKTEKNEYADYGSKHAIRQEGMREQLDWIRRQLEYSSFSEQYILRYDLKRGEIEHYDVGQMNMYLNYFKSEKNTEGDNPPIGIVLGAYKDQLLMEYATQGLENNLFVSKYQLYLPNREQLQKELENLLEEDKA